jgi:hypothetical protein
VITDVRIHSRIVAITAIFGLLKKTDIKQAKSIDWIKKTNMKVINRENSKRSNIEYETEMDSYVNFWTGIQRIKAIITN